MSSVYFHPAKVAQRTPERVAYTIDTAPYGGSPTSVVCTLYQVAAGARTDVTTTNLSGSPTTSGDTITTPLVDSLAAGASYILEVKFVSGGNTWAPLLQILGEL